MATSKNTLKNWFKTGMFPTQSQFWAWLDSYHHKDENIPVAKIEGLNELLTPVNEHFNDPNAHTELFDKFSEINTIVVDSGFIKQDNVFKALANSRWNIKAQEFTNSADIEIPIPLCAAGMVRTDRVVLNMNNQFVLVQGVEVSDNPVPPTKPVNTLEYTFIPVNDSEVGEPDTPTIGNIFNKKDYDKVYTFNASGADVEIPFNVSGFGTIELTGSLTSVKGFSLIDLAANPTLAEWPHKGKPIYLINRSGHNVELLHNNLTAIVPFNFDSNSSIIIPNNGKILLKVMTNNIIDFFKSWGDDPAKLDKVSTVDVDKVYVKNADGTQGMKPVSELGGGLRSHFINFELYQNNGAQHFINLTPFERFGSTFTDFGRYIQGGMDEVNDLLYDYRTLRFIVPFKSKIKRVLCNHNNLGVDITMSIYAFDVSGVYTINNRTVAKFLINNGNAGTRKNEFTNTSDIYPSQTLEKGSFLTVLLKTDTGYLTIQANSFLIELEEII
ncbi:hypothetical protein [Flavobacterium facile]|uniref:hypothetical protein n=1 Tax=Flavobacterium facile TaxID=2893174 RepID=UPI002E75A849|nr:hypothetical protein [Flavobacterium sp. T-12]